MKKGLIGAEIARAIMNITVSASLSSGPEEELSSLIVLESVSKLTPLMGMT